MSLREVERASDEDQIKWQVLGEALVNYMKKLQA
jgi:hypothetical protein